MSTVLDIFYVEGYGAVWNQCINGLYHTVENTALIHCHNCLACLRDLRKNEWWYYTASQYFCKYCFSVVWPRIEEAHLRRRDRTYKMPNSLCRLTRQIASHRHYNRLPYATRLHYESSLTQWYTLQTHTAHQRKTLAKIARPIWIMLYRTQ
jgi:hypothetical protein